MGMPNKVNLTAIKAGAPTDVSGKQHLRPRPGRLAVEVAHGQDAIDAIPEILFAELEHVHRQLAGEDLAAGIGDHFQEFAHRWHVEALHFLVHEMRGKGGNAGPAGTLVQFDWTQDIPLVVRAMVKKSMVLSYRIENGKPVYLEGEEPGWTLLTDDGKDERQDTDSDLVRGLGNDSLTLNADLAYKLQLSKGTADTLDDLLLQMGIEDRAYVMNDEDSNDLTDAAERELNDWSTGIERADQKLRRLRFDLDNVQVREVRNDPDGSKARNAARGQRTKLINEAIALLNKYGEVLDPGEQFRVQLELMRQQIENEKRLERTRGGGG